MNNTSTDPYLTSANSPKFSRVAYDTYICGRWDQFRTWVFVSLSVKHVSTDRWMHVSIHIDRAPKPKTPYSIYLLKGEYRAWLHPKSPKLQLLELEGATGRPSGEAWVQFATEAGVSFGVEDYLAVKALGFRISGLGVKSLGSRPKCRRMPSWKGSGGLGPLFYLLVGAGKGSVLQVSGCRDRLVDLGLELPQSTGKFPGFLMARLVGREISGSELGLKVGIAGRRRSSYLLVR